MARTMKVLLLLVTAVILWKLLSVEGPETVEYVDTADRHGERTA